VQYRLIFAYNDVSHLPGAAGRSPQMPSSSWDVNGQARRALQVIVADPALGPEVL